MTKSDWTSIISYIIAAFTFFFGIYDPLWSILNLNDDLRPTFTIGLSVFILLIGHFISVSQLEKDFQKDISELKMHMSQLPNLNSLRILPNGDDGIKYLSMRIKEARYIRNTRIPVGSSVKYNTDYAQKYISETKKILKDTDVIIRDIIVNDNINLATELASLSNRHPSEYQYKVLHTYTKGFLNFIIIEDKFNISEVVFGWPI